MCGKLDLNPADAAFLRQVTEPLCSAHRKDLEEQADAGDKLSQWYLRHVEVTEEEEVRIRFAEFGTIWLYAVEEAFGIEFPRMAAVLDADESIREKLSNFFSGIGLGAFGGGWLAKEDDFVQSGDDQ